MSDQKLGLLFLFVVGWAIFMVILHSVCDKVTYKKPNIKYGKRED